MRRITFTPGTRRPTISTPTRPSLAPRASILGDEGRRRDVRKIRDAAYKQQCIDTMYNFLTENGYDQPLTPKTLHSPSIRDFQTIFRFVYSFIEPFDYGQKFEEDFMAILKSLKYPFANEITRSQLIAVTPHTWPVILSMLAWMVGLIYRNCDESAEDVETFFYNFVCSGYLKFMEGNEDDTEMEAEFERQVAALYKESFNEMDELRKELDAVESSVKSVQVDFDETESLRAKRKEIEDDMEGAEQQGVLLDEKAKKYMKSIESTKEEIFALEEQISELRAELKSLQEQIDEQKINPEDVKVMNAEKIELYKELERLKPEKEELFTALNKLEQELWTRVDEFEKLNFDLQTLMKSAKIRVIKDQNVVEDVEIEGDLDELQQELAGATETRRGEVLYLTELKSKLEEKRAENSSVLADYEEKIKHMNDKLFRTGKLYIEKKEVSEIEQRKSQKEMEKIEDELLKLSLESNSSLLLSEQNLQRAKIILDRTVSTICYEREEIGKLVSGFRQKLESLFRAVDVQQRELRKLLDEWGSTSG